VRRRAPCSPVSSTLFYFIDCAGTVYHRDWGTAPISQRRCRKSYCRKGHRVHPAGVLAEGSAAAEPNRRSNSPAAAAAAAAAAGAPVIAGLASSSAPATKPSSCTPATCPASSLVADEVGVAAGMPGPHLEKVLVHARRSARAQSHTASTSRSSRTCSVSGLRRLNTPKSDLRGMLPPCCPGRLRPRTTTPVASRSGSSGRSSCTDPGRLTGAP
jgi:hypothetical protein